MKYNISSNLLEEYKNSVYKILSPQIQIHLEELNPKIDNLLVKYNALTWGFISAYNPLSIIQEDLINQKENIKLKKNLLSDGYKIFDSLGFNKKGEYPLEKNFFILDIQLDRLNQLALEFKQNAFLYGKISEKANLILTRETL